MEVLDQRVLVEVRRVHKSLRWSVRKTAAMLTANGWQTSVTSAQRLLDRSESESARRTLTVAEWLHLAYTFGVPPIGLVAPAGEGFRVGRDDELTTAALESWIVGAAPLPNMAAPLPEDDDDKAVAAATITTRYLDAARARSPRRTRFGDYLRRMADAFDRGNAAERQSIVLDMLQHMAAVGLEEAKRREKR